MQIYSNKSLTATERILQYIDYKGLTKYQFHKKNGFSNGFLDTPRAIGTDKCEKILEYYPEINPIWLLTGKGEMLVEEKPSVATVAPHGAQLDAFRGKIIEINPEALQTNTLIADVNASAGFGAIADNHQALEELPAIHLPNAPHGLNIAFQINGDSMHPTIRHLDFVAGTQINDPKDIREGYTYIIVHKYEGVLCKRLYRLGTDWQIVSDNPTYKPHNYPEGEIIGFYKAFCRWSYDFRNYHDDVRADVLEFKAELKELRAEVAELKSKK